MRKPLADYYQVVYLEALTIERALVAVGVSTPRDVKITAPTPRDVKTTPPKKKAREQRLAALGEGTQRSDDDSLHNSAGCSRGGGTPMKDQFCLAHASRAHGLSGREYCSGCERCASHNKKIREFYKGLSDGEVLDKFQPSA